MTDFESMLKVFDEAINSDDPRVKQALNSLVMIVSLARDSDVKYTSGPFAEMRNEMRHMQQEIGFMRNAIDRLERTAGYRHSRDELYDTRERMARLMQIQNSDVVVDSIKQILGKGFDV